MSVFTSIASTRRDPHSTRYRVRAVSKSLFLVSAFIEGFVKFPYDAHAFFFLQTVLELPPLGALQCYHLQCSLFFFCISLSPVTIVLKKPKSTYWMMIFFATLSLIGLILLVLISYYYGSDAATLEAGKYYVVLGATALTSAAYGGKWFWTRRAIYEQHRFPKELDEYVRGLLNNIFVMNLGRVAGMNFMNFICRRGPSINYLLFYGMLVTASVLELLVLLIGLMMARRGSSSHQTAAADMLKKEINAYFQRKPLPEKSVIRTIVSILPLYVPVVFLLGYRDQKFSRFVRQAELLDLQVTEEFKIHPTFLNVVQPIVIVIFVYPFQMLLNFLSNNGIIFRTPTRTLCAFIFMALSLLGGSLVQVFVEDRAKESILFDRGCVVVYNTLDCPASVSTKLRTPVIANPMSHIMMISTAHIDILEENNKLMRVTALCSAGNFTVRTLLEVEEMQISEYLLIPVTAGEEGHILTGVELIQLPPRMITSTFFFADTMRIIYTTSFNMTIGGKVPKFYTQRKLTEYANPLEVFPDGRYTITINGLLLHELEISKGTSITILITRNIKRHLRSVPLTKVIEILPPNIIAFYYQIPQIFLQGLADLMIDTPGYIYACNVVSYEWREALQVMWYFTQAVANLAVATGVFEFHTPLYNYLVGFSISVWSTIFFVEVTRHYYTQDNEKPPPKMSEEKPENKAKTS